jgi:adenylate kinase
MPPKLLNIIILGPQGSGKGTQAVVLAKKFGLQHVETGKIFRAMARRPTALGRTIHRLMNEKGRLIPSPLVIKVLRGVLKQVNLKKGLVFDGYPRNLAQARALDRLLRQLKRPLTQVFYLPISRTTTIKRLALRRICRRCGRIFILGKNLPRGVQTCPVCHGQIYQRDDDKPRAIAKRLELYLRQTKPLIAYYKRRGILITVNGEPSIPVVTKRVLRYLP